MKQTIIVCLLLLFANTFSGCNKLPSDDLQTGAPSLKIPSFLKAGKRYSALFGGVPGIIQAFSGTDTLNLLEIDKAGWIKIQTTKSKDSLWVNLEHVIFMAEVH